MARRRSCKPTVSPYSISLKDNKGPQSSEAESNSLRSEVRLKISLSSVVQQSVLAVVTVTTAPCLARVHAALVTRTRQGLEAARACTRRHCCFSGASWNPTPLACDCAGVLRWRQVARQRRRRVQTVRVPGGNLNRFLLFYCKKEMMDCVVDARLSFFVFVKPQWLEEKGGTGRRHRTHCLK